MPAFGRKPDRPDVRDHRYLAPERLLHAEPLPKLIDRRGMNMPPVYDQGDLGSCVANAIGGAIEYDRNCEGLKPDWPTSRLFTYYNGRVIEGDVPDDSGLEVRDGIKAVNTLGACPESMWPYDISQFAVKPPAAAYTEAAKHPAVRYTRVAGASAADFLYRLKHCIWKAAPVVIGFDVFESFMNIGSDGLMPMPSPTEGDIGGHSVLVVGYEDVTQRVICRNSWGTSWGNKGYFYMPYAYVSDPTLTSDCWSILLVK